MSDKSIEELEVKVAFLEDALAQLSDEFFLQQKELDELKGLYTMLLDKFRSVNSVENTETDIQDERPPHY